MVEKNLRLVEKIAARFRDRGYDREEIVQVGVIGLIKAVDKFDSEYNTQFSTYAFPVIEGEIKRFLRDDNSVKVSRSLKETAMKGRRAEEKLRRSTGRDPTISEISLECGIAADELIEAFSASSPTRSIYESIYDGKNSEISLMDTLADDKGEDEIINHVLVSDILSSLSARERTIIVMRYFESKTQREIADAIGVSQVQVSRLEKKILTELREKNSDML
jgi:RNA polymerase sporulation-specific sigma factor